MIGTDGERELGKSKLGAQLDDDDDMYINNSISCLLQIYL